MKIVCDACQAKYSISDDKVQGKVFKIRCKKCSNIIVVRGGAGAAEPAAPPAQEKETRVYDYGYEGGDQPPAGDESVWHVVINQDQVGPMTAAEVQQRFAGGEIDGETYAWREGFADWLPLSQVDTFAAFVASGSTTAAVTGVASGASAVAAMFSGSGEETGGTARSDPGDLFAAASASSHTSEDDGGDLFGSKPAAKSATAAADAANAKLRGERNENSVLFSLNNLAQLASDKPVSATPAASSAPGGSGHATGAAGGEGSGLIDIRSMANAYLGGGGAGASKPATSSAIGSIDDLPVFGGGGFSEPAVIVPTARAQSNSKLMYALIGSVAALAIAAVILVIVLMKDDKKPAAVASSDEPKSETKEPDKGSADETKPPESGTAPVADPTAGKTTEPTKTAEPTKDPTPGKTEPPKKEPKRPKGGTVARGGSTKEPAPAKAPPPAKEPASSGGCDEVSCVLNNYEGSCCARYRKGGSKPPSGGAPSGGSKSDLPESLDRSMISEGVARVKARIQTCGDKSSKKGTVNVSVKVSASGGVTSVTVNSAPDTALGTCVAGAMQRASFKKTQNGGSFRYPAVF